MPPRKRDRGERDKDGSSPRSASSPREKRPRSGWDAAPKPSDSSEKSSGALPPRPAGPAPAHIKKAAAKAAAAIKSQSSPVQALELQLPRGSDDRSAAPSMSPRTPSASPTSSPAAASTPGSGALAKIGVLNQIKQVEVELAVKKKEMDGLKKEWIAKQEDFEERRQEHDDAEEQRLQAEEEKLRREQEAEEGKRRREEDGEVSDEEDELALDEDVEDADGTLGITKRITKENMAKAKKAARLSGRINKLWHADMKVNNVSAKGRPLYETPESAPLYQKVAAQHLARWDGVVAIVRSRKAAESAHGRKLGKQWAKLKKKWEAKPKKLKGSKTPRGGGGGAASWDDGPPLTPRTMSSHVRSEAEFQSIIAMLAHEQADKTCHVPDMEPAAKYRLPQFESNNGLVRDSMALLKEQSLLNQWSEEERAVFYDRFVHYEKHEERFHKIAEALGKLEPHARCTTGLGRKKSHGDVVRFYYMNKKTEAFSKEVRTRQQRRRMLKKAQEEERRKNAAAAPKRSPKASDEEGAGSEEDESYSTDEEEIDEEEAERRRKLNKSYWTVAEEGIFGGEYQRFHTAEGRDVRHATTNSKKVNFRKMTERFEHSKSDVQLQNLWLKYDERLAGDVAAWEEASQNRAMPSAEATLRLVEGVVEAIKLERQQKKASQNRERRGPSASPARSAGSGEEDGAAEAKEAGAAVALAAVKEEDDGDDDEEEEEGKGAEVKQEGEADAAKDSKEEDEAAPAAAKEGEQQPKPEAVAAAEEQPMDEDKPEAAKENEKEEEEAKPEEGNGKDGGNAAATNADMDVDTEAAQEASEAAGGDDDAMDE